MRKRSPRLADKLAEAVQVVLHTNTVTLPAEAAIGRVIAELASELDRLHQRRDVLLGESRRSSSPTLSVNC